MIKCTFSGSYQPITAPAGSTLVFRWTGLHSVLSLPSGSYEWHKYLIGPFTVTSTFFVSRSVFGSTCFHGVVLQMSRKPSSDRQTYSEHLVDNPVMLLTVFQLMQSDVNLSFACNYDSASIATTCGDRQQSTIL